MNRNCACAVVIMLLLTACGAKKSGGEEYVANDAAAEAPAGTDQIALGEVLVKGNDCNTCHHMKNTIVGPSHTAVAEKYEFNETSIKYLAEKIMQGGNGVWGQIPMVAHADVSQSDAEAMARYVLSLDGEKEH